MARISESSPIEFQFCSLALAWISLRMLRFTRKLSACVLIAMFIAVCSNVASAQRRGGSETDFLKREDIQSQLSLSEEQSQKLKDLQNSATTSREVFSEFAEKLRAAENEEERNKIRAELQAAVAKANSAFEDTAITVLNDDQKKLLRGLYLQNAGTRALSDQKISEEFGLTDEQKEKIEGLAEERREASRNLGFEASDEDRDKFNAEWQSKLLAVLSTEQKSKWDQQLAAIPTENTGELVAQRPGAGEVGEMTPPPSVEPPPGETAYGSFGSESAAPGQLVESFSFNFRYTPWEQVLQMFAEGAGLTLDIKQLPPGSFNHFDDNSYTARQALDIMNGYLLREGYAMVEKDRFLVVLNIDGGIPPSMIPDRSIEELLKSGDEIVVGDNEIVRVEMPIENMETARAAQEIEPVLGPVGSMVALTESRLLIITDIGSNLRRIHNFLQGAMTRSKPDDLVFKSYFLRNIHAEEAEIQLMTLFGMRQAAVNVSYGAESSRDRRGPPQPQQQQSNSSASLMVSSDLRTNSLFVTGTEKQHALVKEIIDALDVSENANGEPLSGAGRRGTYLEVYQVSSADAGEVTKTLTALNLPGVTIVNEDRRNGKIHVMASSRQHEEVAALIRQLDGSGGSESVAVIPLVRMDPLSAAATLRSLFLSDGDSAPTIETDLYGRRLIVRGSFDQITQIKTVLAQLGEDGSGQRPPSAGGQIRRYSLQGRSADEFLDILQQAWRSSERNPIRVEIPARRGPIDGLETPEGPVQPRNAEPKANGEDNQESTNLQNNEPYIAVGMQTEGLNKPAQDDLFANTTGEKSDSPEVLITVIGEELVLSSSDEAALDRLEELLDSLQQSLPYRTSWTVFYLQTADATDAADMLSQIFPSSSVATTTASAGSSFLGSLGSNFSSLGSSVADATGLSGLGSSPMTLQIIPDVRSNSLFISGTDSMIADVREVLRILDSNEIPESLRDMRPRTIVLEYADVDEVATILRDIYKPLMEPQGGNNRQQQGNPLAALMGGGGGNDESTRIRMTLGVDRQTSTLIVSSSEDVFMQVQETVQGLDDLSKQSNRMIRVVPLQHADVTQVQNSLTNLLPRVSVSSSRTSGGSSSSTGGSSARGGSSSSSSNDAAAQAFRDQMRARFFGGGTGGGGRPSFGGSGGRPSFGGGSRPGGGFGGGRPGGR